MKKHLFKIITMKTAMQEFWNKIALKLSVEQVNEFLPEFDKALEKEKNQIMNDYKEGFNQGILYCNEEKFSSKEEYYNILYSQNK